MSFNGTDVYVEVPDHGTLNFGVHDFSIDAWLLTDQDNGVVTLLDKRTQTPIRGYSLYVFNGNLGIQLADGLNGEFTNFNSSAFVADNQWHHIAVTIDRNNPAGGNFYVDGSPEPFNPMSRMGDLTNMAPLRIGGHSFSPSSFNGVLDELEFFDRVLTPVEIQALFQAGRFGKCK